MLCFRPIEAHFTLILRLKGAIYSVDILIIGNRTSRYVAATPRILANTLQVISSVIILPNYNEVFTYAHVIFFLEMIKYLVLAHDKNRAFVCLYHLIALIWFHTCKFALKRENFTLSYSLSLPGNFEHINIRPIKILLGKKDPIKVSLDCKFGNHFSNVGQSSRITTTYWDCKNWMPE